MNPMLLIITIAAIALASIMSVIAWRAVREERRRADARVALLAAEIHRLDHGPDTDLPLRRAAAGPSSAAPAAPYRSLTTAIGAGAVIMAGVAATLVMATIGADPLASGSGRETTPRPSTALTPVTIAPAQPLELVALTHQREQNRLIVRGTVRNPGGLAGTDHLSAVVLLFNAEGGFLTSGRTEISAAGLPAGTEASFVVSIAGAADVGRYRVSFRSDDRVVPHVDRRRS